MSDHIIPASQYREIFLQDRPLIDTRAPIEFDKGAFPSSVNLPLMMDGERQKVGTCYKEQGPDAALALGHELVRGKTKQKRVDAWIHYLQANPNAYINCFRGGERSRITQGWIKDAGIEVPFVEGGYKAMRQYLIDTIEAAPVNSSMCILSGITGSGKTDFLHLRAEAVDLKALPITEAPASVKSMILNPHRLILKIHWRLICLNMMRVEKKRCYWKMKASSLAATPCQNPSTPRCKMPMWWYWKSLGIND